ncbi:MAG: alpha/beta fold hydrolase [Leptonema sp. (in: bacteria)]
MRKFYFLFFILFLISFVYFLPVTKKDFLDIYKKKDRISEQFLSIKKESINKVIINHVEWNYIIKKNKKPSTSTILFLHGMTGSFDIWCQQYYFFQEEFNVISYTLPEAVRTLKDTARGILKILEKENINKVILVGSSMGGYIAQYFLKKYPEKVEKVVFSNTFPPNTYFKDQNEFKAKLLFFLPEVLFDIIGKKQFKDVVLPTSLNSKPKPWKPIYFLSEIQNINS